MLEGCSLITEPVDKLAEQRRLMIVAVEQLQRRMFFPFLLSNLLLISIDVPPELLQVGPLLPEIIALRDRLRAKTDEKQEQADSNGSGVHQRCMICACGGRTKLQSTGLLT